MKNIYSLIIALLMIVTLNISRVSADTETPTPTETPTVTVTPSPTPKNLFATAEATENYSDCPMATLDPNQYIDPMYFMQCYQCMPTKASTATITPTISATPTITETLNLTETQTPAPTNTETPIPIVTATEFEDFGWIYVVNGMENTPNYGYFSGDFHAMEGQPDGVLYYYTPQTNLGGGGFWGDFGEIVPAGSTLKYSATGCRDKADAYYYSLDGANWVKYATATAPGTTPVDARYFAVLLDPCTSATVGIDAMWFEIQSSFIPSSTPTLEPTMTSTPATGYCNNWDYLETGAENQIASISNIKIYAPEEIILLRGDYIDLSWIGSERLSEPIGWPTIALSVIKVDLGDVYILGFRLPIEMIVLPFVMFAISLLMRL